MTPFKGFLISIVMVGAAIFGGTQIYNGAKNIQNQNLGAGYAPVTGFQTFTTSRVSASDSVIPVASVKDKAGNAIVPSLISSSSTVRMYFNFEPGTTREEPFFCTGISGLSLTGCVRGISFQGSSLTSSSTIAQIHNAGAAIIMTNTGVFYGNEFIAVSGAQTKYGVMTFDSYPRASSTISLCTTDDQFCTKYYIDNVASTGFTAANIDQTQGLLAEGTVPEKVAMSVSSTGGLVFDAVSGEVSVHTSSTASDMLGGYLKHTFDAFNVIYWDAVSFLAGTHIWGGTNTFAGSAYVNTPPAGTPTGLAANDIYVSQQTYSSNATTTAGMNLIAGLAIFMSPTSSNAILTNSSIATSTYAFIGIVASTTNSGGIVAYTKPGGINCNQSALLPGVSYYLNGTAGQVTSTPGTLSARIGVAISNTCLQVIAPKFIRSGTITITNTGASSTYVGFYPAHLRLAASTNNNFGSDGSFSYWDDSGDCISLGANAAAFQAGVCLSGNVIENWQADNTRGQVQLSSRDKTGFTLNTSAMAGGGTNTVIVHYTATSE